VTAFAIATTAPVADPPTIHSISCSPCLRFQPFQHHGDNKRGSHFIHTVEGECQGKHLLQDPPHAAKRVLASLSSEISLSSCLTPNPDQSPNLFAVRQHQ